MQVEYKWTINLQNKIIRLVGNILSSLRHKFNFLNRTTVFQAEQKRISCFCKILLRVNLLCLSSAWLQGTSTRILPQNSFKTAADNLTQPPHSIRPTAKRRLSFTQTHRVHQPLLTHIISPRHHPKAKHQNSYPRKTGCYYYPISLLPTLPPVPSLNTGSLEKKKKKGKEESQINEICNTTFSGNLLPNRSHLWA